MLPRSLFRPLFRALPLCLWLLAVGYGFTPSAQAVEVATAESATTDTVATPTAATTTAFEAADGFWRTQGGDGVIELYRCEEKLCGRIHWQRPDSDHLIFDIHNPDKARHNDALCGKQILEGFTPISDTSFKDGLIYNPRDGSQYHAQITLKDADTLLLRGYVLAPLLGQTQTWTRIDDEPSCTIPTAGAAPMPAHD